MTFHAVYLIFHKACQAQLWMNVLFVLQGVKFLRRFKQLLNPAQIFDLMNGGPHAG